jgi:hypothetical protein
LFQLAEIDSVLENRGFIMRFCLVVSHVYTCLPLLDPWTFPSLHSSTRPSRLEVCCGPIERLLQLPPRSPEAPYLCCLTAWETWQDEPMEHLGTESNQWGFHAISISRLDFWRFLKCVWVDYQITLDWDIPWCPIHWKSQLKPNANMKHLQLEMGQPGIIGDPHCRPMASMAGGYDCDAILKMENMAQKKPPTLGFRPWQGVGWVRFVCGWLCGKLQKVRIAKRLWTICVRISQGTRTVHRPIWSYL